MTVFEFAVGDRAAVETLSGTPRAGEVIEREVHIEDCRPVPHITVQVADNVAIQVPASDASPP